MEQAPFLKARTSTLRVVLYQTTRRSKPFRAECNGFIVKSQEDSERGARSANQLVYEMVYTSDDFISHLFKSAPLTQPE